MSSPLQSLREDLGSSRRTCPLCYVMGKQYESSFFITIIIFFRAVIILFFLIKIILHIIFIRKFIFILSMLAIQKICLQKFRNPKELQILLYFCFIKYKVRCTKNNKKIKFYGSIFLNILHRVIVPETLQGRRSPAGQAEEQEVLFMFTQYNFAG